MTLRAWLMSTATAIAVALGGAGVLPAADEKKADKNELYTFGALKAATPEAAKAAAAEWMKSVGKNDAATTEAFEAIWKDADRSVLDRTIATLALGSADAKKALEEARDPAAPAPKDVPALLRDEKQSAFLRANLALGFARSLSNRRVFEEALDALEFAKIEEVIDPAAYLFHKAVCEHGMIRKTPARTTILRLLDDCPEAPDRYRMVATLMFFDIEGWKDKDLGNITRLMDNSERRLDLARGGDKTQEIQKKIVNRLDEVIKELENEANSPPSPGDGKPGDKPGDKPGSGKPNNGQCPGGGQGNKPGNTTKPSSPQTESIGGTTNTPGKVDEVKLKEYAEKWGSMPAKERAKAMADMTKDLPPRYREIVENYFRSLSRVNP